jgi:hypothetical protein
MFYIQISAHFIKVNTSGTNEEGEIMRKIILFPVIAMALVLSLATVVYAAPSINLTDGYEIITNWHGVDVPPGTEVIATAMTTDASVTHVTFLWKNPSNITNYIDPDVPVYTTGTMWDGKLIYYANSTYTPTDLGDWGVQALFQDSIDRTIQDVTNVVAIRARSFNVIPEIPIIGTVGASIAMLLGLAYKTKRKPQK